jgi:hypothetical protein
MECQLKICQSKNLSLSLKKLHIFLKQFEFIGIDVCPNGNQPAMSKHQLLHHWLLPIIVCNVAKFVGFMQFYSRFIPNFEVRIAPLCKLMREENTEPLGAKWTSIAIAAWNDMRESILKDPCLCQYNHRKLLVLRTNFSAEGFGYVACQPADNNASMHMMHQCMHDSSFDFMTKDSTTLLHPVAFGCRRMRSNEKHLHSHLGKAFAGDVAINKCRHMCLGQRFVWVTNCYALKFILLYDGRNPSILHLQMQFMCWDMIIKHRNDVCLTDVDYFSRLGADLYFDPLLKEYIQQAHALVAAQRLPTCPSHRSFSRTSVAHASTAQNHSCCRKDLPCMPTLQPSQLPPAFSSCKICQCHLDNPGRRQCCSALSLQLRTYASCKYVSPL